jgi:hypothetical protein
MKTETRIRIANAIALTTALWTILPDWRSHVFLFRGLGGYAQVAGVGVTVSVVLFELALLLQLVSAVALMWRRRWAWVLAVVALSVLALLPALGAIRLLLFPLPPPSPVPEGHVVATRSMLPSYVRAILNGIAVLLLCSKSLRAYFLKSNMESRKCLEMK